MLRMPWARLVLCLLTEFCLLGCSGGLILAPARFPQWKEQAITPVGEYLLPRWSPDGRYLAYLADSSAGFELTVYEVESGQRYVAASGVWTGHYDWTPDGRLTYLQYRPELSGMPYPIVLTLHAVEIDGADDQVVVASLYGAGNFAWLKSGQQLFILLGSPETTCGDAYLLTPSTGEAALFVAAKEAEVDCISMLALSPDETRLLVYGVQQNPTGNIARLNIYDTATKERLSTIIPGQVIPHSNLAYPPTGIADSSVGWISDTEWLSAIAYAPAGDCYNYALLFLDLADISNTFCIPTVSGIVTGAVVSPDGARLAYITVTGPGSSFVMMTDLPSDLKSRLGIAE